MVVGSYAYEFAVRGAEQSGCDKNPTKRSRCEKLGTCMEHMGVSWNGGTPVPQNILMVSDRKSQYSKWMIGGTSISGNLHHRGFPKLWFRWSLREWEMFPEPSCHRTLRHVVSEKPTRRQRRETVGCELLPLTNMNQLGHHLVKGESQFMAFCYELDYDSSVYCEVLQTPIWQVLSGLFNSNKNLDLRSWERLWEPINQQKMGLMRILHLYKQDM